MPAAGLSTLICKFVYFNTGKVWQAILKSHLITPSYPCGHSPIMTLYLLNEANRLESNTPELLRFVLIGPGHELLWTHRANGNEVKCHVVFNKFRRSPGTFRVPGYRQLSHTEPCNADLPRHSTSRLFYSGWACSETKQELKCAIKTCLAPKFPPQAAETAVVTLLHWEWLSQKFLLTVL